MDINEQAVLDKTKQYAEKYERRFDEEIGTAAEIFNERNKGVREWNDYDSASLGTYMETWSDFSQIFESDAATRDTIGEPLKAGLGLVALQYATSPITAVASVQPMMEESGVIYFRKLIATATRGGISKGDTLLGSTGNPSYAAADYMAENVSVTADWTSEADGVDTTITADFAAYIPLRPRSFSVTIQVDGGAPLATALDDGSGNLIGVGIRPGSTVNYETGACQLVVNNQDIAGIEAATAYKITWNFSQNIAQSANIPGFMWEIVNKNIQAQYFILQTQWSSLADFSTRRRFGKAISDDVAVDAVAQINAAVLSKAIATLITMAQGNPGISFSGSAPTNVSLADHRRTFGDALDECATAIGDDTGRGAISFIIAGSETRKILNTLGFDSVRKPIPGPYMLGVWEGVPVFYAPTSLLAADKTIVGYRGSFWYESPLVYAPFLPVMTVKAPGQNVFNTALGCAHAAGIEGVIPEFVREITIT